MSAWGNDRQLIDGRFELLDQLGGGGMGRVWRARDTVLQRDVALKEVRHAGGPGSDPAAEQLMRERVLREARALARLHHPNVVTIHHIVDRPDLPYPWLVMELVTGGSLAGRLDKGPLGPNEAARIGRGVLAALRAAHDAGIQHRDVKPANVLLREDGSPVLTDFGIAALQESSSLTATGSLIGSPEYIAPERVRGEEGNPASDFWSLGILLYSAVEGRNPMRRATSLATLAAVLDQPIPEPAHAGPLTPVLSALLVRDPAERPDPETLDRMLAQAEAGWAPDPYASGARLPQPADAAELANSPGHTHTITIKRRRFTGYIIGIAVAGVIGAMVWTITSLGSHSNNGPILGNSGTHAPSTVNGAHSGSADSPGATAGTSSETGASTGGFGSGSSSDPSQAQSAITPAGMRALVSTMRSTLGTTVVAAGTIYPDTATFHIPNKSNPINVDSYDYSGTVFSDPTPIGTMDTEHGTMDLSKIDWSILTPLFNEVDSKTGTPNATDHYLILDPKWFDYGPCVLIYSANDYGGGYIAANTKGQIIRVYGYSS